MTIDKHNDRPESANPATVEPSCDDTATGESEKPREIGGRKGPDPTRYGDWEKNGRCIDF